MRNLIVSAAIALISFAGFTAHADQEDRAVKQPVWTCGLSFQAEGGGIQIFVGYFEMQGPGTIRCVDVSGNTQDIPVYIRMGGSPLAANVAIGHFIVNGVASGIGVASGPQALLGQYYSLNAQASILYGAGGSITVHGGNEAVTMDVGVRVVRGVGAQIGINSMTISAR